MPISLSGRDFLRIADFSTPEIEYLLRLAHQFKALKLAGTPHRYLQGKNVVLLFQKTSTRTRCSFEVGAMDLGMGVTFLDPKSSQMGTKESIADTAHVLERFYDGIEFRGFAHADVEELARNASVPVWNGLTDLWHPTQMICDMMTLQEKFNGNIKGKKLVFMGDAKNNVARSLMVTCAKLGLDYIACGPEDCMPAQDVLDIARPIAEANGCTISLEQDPAKAVSGADVIYTDVWVSMGEPDSVWEHRVKELMPYQVNSELMAKAADDVLFLHCLPAYHDTKTKIGADIYKRFGISEQEVTDEVFKSSRSVVFDEAENRMHAIKAIMYATLK